MRTTMIVLLSLLTAAFSRVGDAGERRDLAVGDPAPPIRLNDETGTARSVGGEAKAITILAFYPKAATPG